MIGTNNPLNIRTSAAFNWNGQTGATRGFCNFADVVMCRRAGAYLLMRSYRRAGCLTITDIIQRYAPASENPTKAYISFVSSRAGLDANTPLVFANDYACVLAAMEMFEQGISVSKRTEYFYNARASYLYIIDHFNLKLYEVKS